METMAEQAAEMVAMTSDGSSHDDSVVCVAQSSKPPPPQSAFQSLPLVHPKKQHSKRKKTHHHMSPASPAVSKKLLEDSLMDLFQGTPLLDEGGVSTKHHAHVMVGTEIPRHSHRSSSHRGGSGSRRSSMSSISTRSRTYSGSAEGGGACNSGSQEGGAYSGSQGDDDASFAVSDLEEMSSSAEGGRAASGSSHGRRQSIKNTNLGRRSSTGSSSSSSLSLADPSRDFGYGSPTTKQPTLNSSLSFNQHNRQSFASIVDDANNYYYEDENTTTLFDNLSSHWPETTIAYDSDKSVTTKHYQQACLASFVVLFGGSGVGETSFDAGRTTFAGPPAPTTAVVIQGLWACVVLPTILMTQEDDSDSPATTSDDPFRAAEMLAQEAWTSLTTRLGYLQQGEDSTVSVTHAVYVQYGLWLAGNYEQADKWKTDFAMWMLDSFVSSSSSIKELAVTNNYAAKALLPMLLDHGMYAEASSLLLESTSEYASRLWEALHGEENALQLTERYVVGNIERYLSYQQQQKQFDTKHSDQESMQVCQSQEVLGFYEAWYTLLLQRLEQLGVASVLPDASSCPSSDAYSSTGSTNGTLSDDDRSAHSSQGSSTNGSEKKHRRQERKQRRERRRQRRRQLQEARNRQKRHDILQNPLSILVLGRAMHILAESLMESSFFMTDDDGTKAPSLWRRQAEYLAQAMRIFSVVMVVQPNADDDDDEEEDRNGVNDESETKRRLFQRVATLLCADSWVTMSECTGSMKNTETPIDEFQLLSLTSLFAPCLKTHLSMNASDPRLTCLQMAKALLENPVETGGAAKKASRPIMTRRLQLFRDTLRGDVNDAIGRLHFDRNHYDLARESLDEAVRRKRAVLTSLRDVEDPSTGMAEEGILSLWKSTSAASTTEPRALADNIVETLCLHRPKETIEKEIEEVELSLSRSLEYAALVLHQKGFSMPALSLLQESLLLETGHLGKVHMEVARLNAAMAAVHDDLMQWEAALPRRRECLKVRMQFLSQFDPTEWLTQHEGVFLSVLETLRAMGNSYRMLEDYDNAIGCYWKIATLARRQWEVLRDDPNEHTKFYGFTARDHHGRLGEDLRTIPVPTIVLDELRYDTSSKTSAPSFESQSCTEEEATEREDSVLREVAQSYQIIMSLFKDKEFASRKKQASSSKRILADVIAEQDVPLLLSASYELGIIHMYYGDYRSAMYTFDHSLQSIWVMDPSSSESSGTDSYSDEEYSKQRTASRKRIQQRRNRHQLGVFENKTDEIHEEDLYHAVGLCRVACNEPDQAIRFHMTALRYARRFHGTHSPKVAKILYDVAACYWRIHEYEKALEFWSACCQIHLRKDRNLNSAEESESDDGVDTAASSELNDFDHAKALHNVGATLCAMGRFRNHMALACFEEARDYFSDRSVKKTAELASCLFYMSLIVYHQAGSDIEMLSKAQDLLKESIEKYRELGWAGSIEDPDLNRGTKNPALQAHLFCLQGSILNAMGNVDLALGSLQTAYRLYDSEGATWNLHKASVLYAIGEIYKSRDEDIEALRCFDDALQIRISRLGPGHEAVGAALYQVGDMFARRDEYVTAMEMYNEARRILLATGGEDSPLVAKVLLQMGALQAKESQLSDALESLKGALVIRKHRTGMVFQASRGSSDFVSISLRHSRKPKGDGENMLGETDDALRKKFEEELAREKQELAVVLHCIGNVYNVLRDYDNAILSYEEAVEAWESHQSTSSVIQLRDSPVVCLADTLHNLGCVHAARKNYENALEYLTKSLQLKRAVDSPIWENPNSGSTEVVSVVLYNANPEEDSSRLYQGDSLTYAITLHRIGMVYARMNNSDAAVSCLESVLTIQRRLLEVDSLPIAQTLSDMGNALRGVKHRRNEALHFYQEALGIRQRQRAAGNQVGELLYRIGTLHDADRQCARAMVYYQQAIQVYGRRYVHSVGRRLCQAMLLRPNSAIQDDDGEDDPMDLFHSDGTANPASIADREKVHRDHFRKVCTAMRQASQSGSQELDIPRPHCWVSLELYLYSLMDLLHLVAGEWRDSARRSLQNGLRQLDLPQGTLALPPSSQDTVLFQMLYLIQD